MEAEVLIVGLGPVGAVLAGLLGQRGVRVIVVEKETDPYPLPRAVHFDHEIMRLFQQLGVAEQVLAHVRDVPDYEFRNAAGEVLMMLPPARETPSGWGGGYMFHQPGLEAVLRERLTALPSVEVRIGVRLDGFSQGSDGVVAEVVGADGAETIRARYLVGCDGASSPVREAIGGGLFDYQFDEPWLVVDVRAGEDCTTPRRNIQLCDPARPTTCVLSGPGRHRWEFMLLPGEDPEAMRTDAAVRALLAPWNCGPVEIERRAVYRFHGLVANRWRDGRALIAGDAAHQTPPFAGQGMCAGVRDAANLAWKLAAVLRGEAGEALLDTYQAEREPHVRAAIELAIGMGRVVCLLDPAAAAQRDAGMLAARESGAPPLPPLAPRPFAEGCILPGAAAAGTMFPQPRADEARLDDVIGDGPWLLSRDTLDDPALAPFRAPLEGWLDRHGVEAVLVRPDRYIFGTGEAAALLAAWTRVTRPAMEAA
ncbi:bifunctional 3-(3-hydroxy-phenyl)propionate/3-hydroxycinnamic acid hydroxylase [Caulobacter sp. NIBR1757]|uniref:bifunctional 3-(3-hydroxy-phenyl)propionate/3-hydroxycinnamic acid hydroxylase MhpA n=1 Tax=Caulobacter sp. NIBR1757 TaxID=3016000 RepID=UPI0022F07623|nr:bifunctional 3-(3-hydroxy-phenyl)propionate/3-hydroxycinnamic acid hydroxylase [Caulobacter sp. NIBR1757]WGM40668.1 putative NADH-specific resorcinol 4-hydroxylase [Caulobacter sp. NIBR1757]